MCWRFGYMYIYGQASGWGCDDRHWNRRCLFFDESSLSPHKYHPATLSLDHPRPNIQFALSRTGSLPQYGHRHQWRGRFKRDRDRECVWDEWGEYSSCYTNCLSTLSLDNSGCALHEPVRCPNRFCSELCQYQWRSSIEWLRSVCEWDGAVGGHGFKGSPWGIFLEKSPVFG